MPLRTANIVGSGPNGLAAAITLAQRGVQVTVYERMAHVGGACTTAELTLSGFHHDVGATSFPMGIGSPFLSKLPLEDFGLRWVHSPAPLAHPLDDGTAVFLERDLAATSAQFIDHDRLAWLGLLSPLVDDWPSFSDQVMRPLRSVPSHPLNMAAFGINAMMPATMLTRLLFRSQRSRALFAGNAAHSVLPLERPASSAAGLVLAAAAHAVGWPLVEGGAGRLTQAMAGYLLSLGGRIELNADITSLAQMDDVDATLFDTSPRALDRVAGGQLTSGFRTRMRHYSYGPAAFKLDWALSQPIPWTAKGVERAATVHLGGTQREIALSEAAAFRSKTCDKPFVLLVQPSLFDPTRAPEGKHTAWAYCHVPNAEGHTPHEDYTERIEAQVERFAPGFRDTILARHVHTPQSLEGWNPNLIGGDLSGGAMTLSQLVSRPTAHLYETSNPKLYLCSASTPPGGGVHGMCGHLAALTALRKLGHTD
jgi:phytoene dehydrogenase-like protein